MEDVAESTTNHEVENKVRPTKVSTEGRSDGEDISKISDFLFKHISKLPQPHAKKSVSVEENGLGNGAAREYQQGHSSLQQRTKNTSI